MDTTNLIYSIVSLLIGGGLTRILTIKYDRKQAEASAMEKLQTVYERMIDDLNEDRVRLEHEITKIKDELALLEKRVVDNERIKRLAFTHMCQLAESCSKFQLLSLKDYEK